MTAAAGACPNCGAAVHANQEFCGACGAAVSAEAPPVAPASGICPRCGVPIAATDPAVACAGCGAPHHQGCFEANGGCAVLGCPSNPLTATVYPAPAPYAPAAAAPPPPAGPNGGLIAGAVGGGVLLVALIVAVVLLASGGNSAPQRTTTVVASGTDTTTSVTTTEQAASQLAPVRNLRQTTRVTPPPALIAPPVTGSDGQYNTGPNCSDNPSSPLPGCADSPSTPNGDPETSCAGGITTDAQTTSCGLAENVKAAYRHDGTLVARSPERGHDYVFACQTGGPGTTHMTICHGQAGSAILYLRWQA